MRTLSWLVIAPVVLSCATHSLAGDAPAKPTAAAPAAATPPEPAKPDELKAEEQKTKGSVTVGGKRIDYTAIAGTLIVKPKDDDEEPPPNDKGDKPPKPPEAMMSFVAYVAGDGKDTSRPITFLYNGGPGSATVWLHMGAFGPRRVATTDLGHTAAPYKFVDNAYSLLDATDLVFIDAPGTGFGKIAGKDKEKAFYGIDADATAFTEFITQFLSKYGRWSSPKYLFGESYGTTRSAVLAFKLSTQKAIALDGVILLAQILNFDTSPDGPEANPGIDLPYQLALPTYAATAWFHKKLTDAPGSLDSLVAEVEQFAMGDYAAALGAGNTLDPIRRKAVIDKLHHYTGLPAALIDKANLRITGGEFEKNLQDDSGLTTGRLDTRFSGPHVDPMSKEPDYDPQQAAIGAPYVAAFNEYARKTLKMGGDRKFTLFAPVLDKWNWDHKPPGVDFPLPHTTNVMPDLAAAMKYNPSLRVQLEAGYYDLATPFYEGVFELQHLTIPAKLQSNISFKFYPSGHMIYANEAALKQLHDNVAEFIRRRG
jgi:carboxypeptidase C (cathepsin A)